MPSVYTAQRRLRERLLRSSRFRRLITRLPPSARTGTLARIFLAFPQWQREVLIADTARELEQLGPARLSAVEVSGRFWHRLPWRSYTDLYFPAFDLCNPPAELPGPFDVVLCEQVIEHVPDPLTAVDTLRRLCKPDGHVFISTPFLIRVHESPGDFWRFTPSGMRQLLLSQGLEPLWVRSWGNRRAVVANFNQWKGRLPWQSLDNEPNFPLQVWSLSRRVDRPESPA